MDGERSAPYSTDPVAETKLKLFDKPDPLADNLDLGDRHCDPPDARDL